MSKTVDLLRAEYQLRNGPRIHISGCATKWDAVTDDGRAAAFCIAEDAFDFCDLTEPSIALKINHETTLCTVGDGNLRIEVRDDGLWFHADFPECTTSQQLLESVTSGELSHASIRLQGVAEKFNSRGRTVPRYRHVDQLIDVSIVDVPGLSSCNAFAWRQKGTQPSPVASLPASRKTVAVSGSGRPRRRKNKIDLSRHMPGLMKLKAKHDKLPRDVREAMSSAGRGIFELPACWLYEMNSSGQWVKRC